jgi:hypothetical protein
VAFQRRVPFDWHFLKSGTKVVLFFETAKEK